MNVGIIGSGSMGSGIAQVAAMAGEQVILMDADPAALQRALSGIQKSLSKFLEKGKINSDEMDATLIRIKTVSDMKLLSDSDLVIEAIVENIDVKRKVFSELESIVSNHCILASNTSSLSITSIASACKIPQRVMGIHFFNPAPLMPLVEIISGASSHSELKFQLHKIISAWKKVPVLAMDSPGFIVNRVARPFYGEALRIYEEGIADFASIDWAMKELGGFKMGPFELMDLIGNDINYKVTETVWTQFYFDSKFKPSITQKRLIEAGKFGRKNGMGFYDYSQPLPEPIKDKKIAELVFNRILMMLINEAADALYYKVASADDIDLAMMKGVNYPKGLLRWADEIGHEKVFNYMNQLYNEYAEERYRPSVQFKAMKRVGKTKFYAK